MATLHQMYEGPDDVRRRGLAIIGLWFAPSSLGLSSPIVTQFELDSPDLPYRTIIIFLAPAGFPSTASRKK